jgi:NAD+ diphosphatase
VISSSPFTATAVTREIRVDHEELEDARWVSREQLAGPASPGFSVPTRYSLASKLIEHFLSTDPKVLATDPKA